MAKKYKELNHNHFLTILLSSAVLILAILFVTTRNSIATPNNIKGTNNLSKQDCSATGSLVINVTQKAINDADSGEAGNYWAYDTVNRQIKVYKQGEKTFCAIVSYEGKFDSQDGQTSPGGTGTLSGKEDGTFKGGYRAVIVGTMLTEPLWQTKGNLGTFDYKCDLSGNCPGAVNWVGQYFSNATSEPSFTYSYWGWQYQYQNHTWINASTGNSGDVI